MSACPGAWGNQPCWHLDLSLAGPARGAPSLQTDAVPGQPLPPISQWPSGARFFSPHHHPDSCISSSSCLHFPTASPHMEVLLSPGGSPSPLCTPRSCAGPRCAQCRVFPGTGPVSAVSPRQGSCMRLELWPTGRCKVGNQGAGKGAGGMVLALRKTLGTCSPAPAELGG